MGLVSQCRPLAAVVQRPSPTSVRRACVLRVDQWKRRLGMGRVAMALPERPGGLDWEPDASAGTGSRGGRAPASTLARARFAAPLSCQWQRAIPRPPSPGRRVRVRGWAGGPLRESRWRSMAACQCQLEPCRSARGHWATGTQRGPPAGRSGWGL